MAQTPTLQADEARSFVDDGCQASVLGAALLAALVLPWAGEIPATEWPGGALRRERVR